MIRINLKDKTFLETGQGSFDIYCVYHVMNSQRIPYKDEKYFNDLLQLGTKYGKKRIYQDFVKVYDTPRYNFNAGVLDLIDSIAKEYPEDENYVYQTLCILYLTMLAEDNRENTILERRIKRLGVHYLLIEEKDIIFSTTSMKGLKADAIIKICEGFRF